MTRTVSPSPEPRFFIDHGMIHDRVTGKHVDTEPVEFEEGQFDASPTLETRDLLNSLADALESTQAEIARLTTALEQILHFSDVEMGDGDGAREVARAALRDSPNVG
jgi:hypothetical protein